MSKRRQCRFTSGVALLGALGLLVTTLTACGEDRIPRRPSGSTCPIQSPLRWDNFGKDFMQKYCLRCHSESVMGADRHNAPGDHNFDILVDVQAYPDHIDEAAAAGPNAVNVAMPPDQPKPTLEERQKLGEWLACGAP